MKMLSPKSELNYDSEDPSPVLLNETLETSHWQDTALTKLLRMVTKMADLVR